MANEVANEVPRVQGPTAKALADRVLELTKAGIAPGIIASEAGVSKASVDGLVNGSNPSLRTYEAINAAIPRVIEGAVAECERRLSILKELGDLSS